MRNKIEIIQTKWYEMHFMIEKYLYLLITVVEYLKNNNINLIIKSDINFFYHFNGFFFYDFMVDNILL